MLTAAIPSASLTAFLNEYFKDMILIAVVVLYVVVFVATRPKNDGVEGGTGCKGFCRVAEFADGLNARTITASRSSRCGRLVTRK